MESFTIKELTELRAETAGWIVDTGKAEMLRPLSLHLRKIYLFLDKITVAVIGIGKVNDE